MTDFEKRNAVFAAMLAANRHKLAAILARMDAAEKERRNA